MVCPVIGAKPLVCWELWGLVWIGRSLRSESSSKAPVLNVQTRGVHQVHPRVLRRLWFWLCLVVSVAASGGCSLIVWQVLVSVCIRAHVSCGEVAFYFFLRLC